MKKHIAPIVSIAISVICLISALVYYVAEPQIGWLSGDLNTLESNSKFNQRCTFCYDYYSDATDFAAASKLMFDETGVQLYLLDLEVSCVENNITNDYDMYNYAVDYVESNIDTDNAVVIYNCYQKEDDLYGEDGYRVYYSIYDQMYIGDSAGDVLKGEALTIFNEAFNYHRYAYDTKYTNSVKLFLNHTKYADECRTNRICTSLLFCLPVIALLAVNIVINIRKRKHANTIEILSTPLDRLSESADLVKKYTK